MFEIRTPDLSQILLISKSHFQYNMTIFIHDKLTTNPQP